MNSPKTAVFIKLYRAEKWTENARNGTKSRINNSNNNKLWFAHPCKLLIKVAWNFAKRNYSLILLMHTFWIDMPLGRDATSNTAYQFTFFLTLHDRHVAFVRWQPVDWSWCDSVWSLHLWRRVQSEFKVWITSTASIALLPMSCVCA